MLIGTFILWIWIPCIRSSGFINLVFLYFRAVFLTAKSLDNKDTFSSDQLEDLMATAQEQGVEVVGVALNPDFNFFADRAAETLKKVFDCARKAGHNISILDLGEMFPIDDDLEDFDQVGPEPLG